MTSGVAEPQEEMEQLAYQEAPEEAEEEEEGESASPSDLSEMLKEGTKEAHDRAENTQFVKEFLKGRIKRELFTLGTVALYFTYSALEEEMERNQAHPALAPLYFPAELHRAPALEQDLAFFFGEGWRGAVSCSEATRRYVERIRQVGRDRPELLAAHAYTRYMGDLSGGQVLRKVAQRALRLPASGEGVRFYDFENVHSAQSFKQLYRARLNALDLDPEAKAQVVREANRAFEFNMQVFEELDKIGALLTEDTQDGSLPVHDGKGDVRKCPFYGAKTGAALPCGCPLALLQQPSAQAAMAACVALLAVGLAVWYLM